MSIDECSSFGLEISPGFFAEAPIYGHDGLVVGTSQLASGAHVGDPDGSESPGIDQPWTFLKFGSTGMHLTTTPVNIVSASGNTASLDFSGWGVLFGDDPFVSVGSGAWNGHPDGVALITCSADCSNGDTYSLYYSATIGPAPGPGGTSVFGNLRYKLNLTGTISAVPIPATVWLFGSGLLGIIGFSKHNKKNKCRGIPGTAFL